ncbi:ion channel [Solimonas terrae]|uniref:Two pore domain potassium channel family protein n=1 Tax=Solimonas terrae TaxID=1396819 RepID=A0A6M2BM45_9GAMM|nr:ion channel [Solimonas terrae]NGY03225.1 two pore domain potassium channel family protein [Solimonas terrae]
MRSSAIGVVMPGTPGLLAAAAEPVYWLTVAATLMLVAAAVVLHYEGLERLNRAISRWQMPPRLRILGLIFCIITLHTAEIWIFGLGIYAVASHPAFGAIGGADTPQLLDAVYLSTTTYTTVGYGDLVPHGPLRLILGSEALTGFVLLTWSASFAYIEMQRYWHGER